MSAGPTCGLAAGEGPRPVEDVDPGAEAPVGVEGEARRRRCRAATVGAGGGAVVGGAVVGRRWCAVVVGAPWSAARRRRRGRLAARPARRPRRSRTPAAGARRRRRSTATATTPAASTATATTSAASGARRAPQLGPPAPAPSSPDRRRATGLFVLVVVVVEGAVLGGEVAELVVELVGARRRRRGRCARCGRNAPGPCCFSFRASSKRRCRPFFTGQLPGGCV